MNLPKRRLPPPAPPPKKYPQTKTAKAIAFLKQAGLERNLAYALLRATPHETMEYQNVRNS